MLWTKQRTSKADPQQPDRSRGTQIKTKESLFRKELWVCPFFQMDWNWIRYKDVCRVFMGVSQATDMDWKALKLSRQKELWPPAFLGQEADWGICSTANIKHFCRMSLLRRWEGRTDVSKTEPKHQRGYFQGKQHLTKSQALPERESCQHLPCMISDLLRTRDCFVLFLFSSPHPSFRQSSVGPLSMVVLSPHCVFGGKEAEYIVFSAFRSPNHGLSPDSGLCTFFQPCFQELHMDALKLAMAAIFPSQRSTNATNQGCFPQKN